MKEKIEVVLVTYNPDISTLIQCINSLINQVERIIIVDNTPLGTKELNSFNHENIELIYLYENMGIAYAQNIGIKKAMDNGAEFVLTSDQDTVYPENYVLGMLAIYKIHITDLRIGAIAPFFRDINSNNELMPIMIYENEKISRLRSFDTDIQEVYCVSHVISSGMIMNRDALLEIGLMDADLFIDWVDTEWCFRANKLNYKILQTSKLVITHQLGDNAKKLFKYTLTNHNYIRRYYRVRNGIYILFYNKYINKSMKWYIIESLLKMVIMHFFQANSKINEIKNKYFAIKDGIVKNIGILKRDLKINEKN